MAPKGMFCHTDFLKTGKGKTQNKKQDLNHQISIVITRMSYMFISCIDGLHPQRT